MVGTERLAHHDDDLELTRHIIDFDPRDPRGYRYIATPGSDRSVHLAKDVLTPDPIPWPQGLAPLATLATPPASDTDPLPTADVLVVTYTVAEAYALADVLTPGWDARQWTPYRNGWDALRPTINPTAPSMQRQQGGLWATCTVGELSVVVVKSDLHPSTDGPDLPIRALWRQMIGQAKPRLVITTGTAGGVQADTLLGDVVVARNVRWDCTLRFPHAPWATAAYTSDEAVTHGEFAAAADQLIPVNAAHLPKAARPPKIWLDNSGKPQRTISTDFFAFDNASNHYGLRTFDPSARAVEMDDAALGLACTDLDDPPPWLSIRNASDPQMDGPDLNTEKRQAAAIYERYGYWTTIGSAIACWAALAGLAKSAPA